MSDDAVLTIASTSVMTVKHFPRATDDWESLPEIQNTWMAWKAAFCTAHTACLHLQAAQGGTGPFGNANAMTKTGTSAECPTIKAVLNNLALATTNNNTTINVLVELNKQIPAMLAALSTKMDSVRTTGTTLTAPAPAPALATVKLTTAQRKECGYDPVG